jgi:small subunit ribosomal protein S8
VQDFRLVESEEGRPVLRVVLKYAAGGNSVIRELHRVSTPGLRKYVGVTEIPRVRNGLGMAILSTSQGILSDRQARQQRTGGELLALVW